MRLDIDIPKDRPVLIAGPTASGKSALALQIAEDRGGAIINADALQVYDGWRILTARPSDADLARAPHHLYGHVPYQQDYSVGQWLREAEPFLSDGQPRPIIIGGTGLYFRALTEGLAEIPLPGPDIRAEGDRFLANYGLGAMVAELDAETRNRIDTNNPARVQRAWEVLRSTGRGLASWQDDTPPPLLPLSRTAPLVVNADKEVLNSRITDRFHAMIDAGALEEARRMLPDWDPKRLSSKAIGAPELIAHLSGEITLDDAIDRAIIASRQYAKRQRTWFRARMKDWHPVAVT
ncbi:tRNA (adenosine(37)-N6)-dimethylallyltransferase MiaA [Aliiroseovarius sp. YM-037]|uniref:tRNA (adenosine(37)-N6)-dimethylallyltransferase MiaA n=1 Tax=Aliiroseovarius sp. YM-037 TaxID=3341728 RepID=UPI003A80FC35